VDQRAEPQPKPWLADGGAGGAAGNSSGKQPSYHQDGRPPSYGPPYPAPARGPVPVPVPGHAPVPVAGAAPVPGPAAAQGPGKGPAPGPVPAPLPAPGPAPPLPGQGLRVTPPYPAQVPPGQGVGSRITAPFATLTRPKPGKTAKPPKPPRRQAKAQRAVPPAAVAAPRSGASPGSAQLSLARIEPWSVMKFSFMISLVGWVVLFVAVAILYYVLNRLGVFHAVQTTITDVTSSKGSAGADASGGWFSASRILGYTMLIGAVNVVLITALATLGAVIYNLVTHLGGGIEVTLKETE
jgi:Transmembrane domain of unknown function (DUF3566)